MYILNSNFSFLKQIGEISKEKFNELKRAFIDYPEIIAQPGRPIIFKKGVSAIAVQPEQITYIYQGDPTDIKLDHIVNELSRLNEILNLPHESVFATQLELLVNYDFDVMEKSREIFNNTSDVLGAKGMGYRFIVDKGKFHGDVHIEPYLKDTQRAYINVILQSTGNININEAHDFIAELFDFSVTHTKEAADDLYKK